MIRVIIRRILIEVYELSQEYKNKIDDIEEVWDLLGYGTPDERTWRALGLQDKKQIEKERKVLQDYQAKLKAHPEGSEMIRDFMSGKGSITCAHSIGYQGMAVGIGEKEPSPKSHTPFTTWLQKYGSNTNAM